MSRILKLTHLLILLSALTAYGTTASRIPGQPKPSISRITLRDVPKAALAAAEQQVPGILTFTEQALSPPTRDAYEIKGLSHHTYYEISVTGDGHVLEVDHGRSLSD